MIKTKKDITIPAGTWLHPAPTDVKRLTKHLNCPLLIGCYYALLTIEELEAELNKEYFEVIDDRNS